MTFEIGVDIGGTFTDLVLIDRSDMSTRTLKVLTTHDDPAKAVAQGLTLLVGEGGTSLARVERLLHGTTLVTNAVITRSGARTGMLTTAGFRDVIEMRRENRPDLYDLFLEHPRPLVPRDLRLEVSERLGSDGAVRDPVDTECVTRAVEELLSRGVISVAICLLHSFRNPAHERQVREIVTEIAPSLSISVSSEVAPIVREYERFSTTVINAYTQPIMQDYIGRLERLLRANGLKRQFLLMLSNGGVAPAETAARFPVRALESGPAAGMIAAGAVAQVSLIPRVIGFDMGGTTAKVCVIQNGRPHVRPQFEVARSDRLKRGSGYPVALPVIDMIEIGAGGGSIARLDSLGLVQVGPESAESHPGPASYGFGGRHATVTDADLVLGYLDPNYFLGGSMPLDMGAARRALLGLARAADEDQLTAAWAVHETVNESMASAVKLHLTEKGEDLRRYSLVAFGGGGPVHAYGVATKLGISQILVPPDAGVASALGLISSPLSLEVARTHETLLRNLLPDEINALIADLETEAARLLGVTPTDPGVTVTVAADMRYVGQTHTLTVTCPNRRLPPGAGDELRSVFETVYGKQYGRPIDAHEGVEVVNWRVTVSALRAMTTRSLRWLAAPGAQPPLSSTRTVYFGPKRRDGANCRIYRRAALARGTELSGPVVIQEETSTTVVGPGSSVLVDIYGNLVVTVNRSR